MSLLNAINNFASNLESIGSTFGQVSAIEEGFGDFMNEFMGENGADKFLSGLKKNGIDPERFLADLQSEGIDPEKFLADMNRDGRNNPGAFLSVLNNNGSLSLNEVAEKANLMGGLDLKKFIAGNDSVVSNILSKNRLALDPKTTHDTAFSFMKGGRQSAPELAALLDASKAALPDTFKKQLGQSLVAMGRQALSANSMKMGADLMGAKNGVKVLKDMLENLKGELGVLKLDKKALPALGDLMAESGLDNDSINSMLADLARGEMSLDQVFYGINKVSNDLEQNASLIATEEGLSGLGQFFSDLGAPPEVVKAISEGFEAGEAISGAALKDIIASADPELLKAPISAADADNVSTCLKAMGASPRQLNSLANLLQQTEGRMSVNDFASFFDEMGPGKDVSVGGKELDLIKNILANVSREQELAKTPVFNEILSKIQALGDQEIDDEFMKMSPALQALRGGISGENADSALGGSSGQNGQQNQNGQQGQNGQPWQHDQQSQHGQQGQNGQQGQYGQQGQSGQQDQQNQNGQPWQHDQQAKEQYRQAMQAIQTGADVTATGTQTVETMQNYGYGGHDTLARQISQKILYSHNRGIHRLRMKLNPESMGGLDIELKVKNGELTAHIKAESREAYEALAGEIDSLKTALAEGGVKLGNMTLAFDDSESGRREFADLGMRGQRPGLQEEEVENIDPAIISQMGQLTAHDGLFSRIA